jgi:glyceraldehyde 3-phosphate dehydrogenase
VIDGRMLKTLSWYDNEWAYSCRVVDLLDLIDSLS